MAPEEHARAERFVRFRRWKRLLKFAPRRAAMHRYPLIGRFAAVARRRAYLWSFKTQHLRPAFYAGSILSLLPVMGVQLPLAFALSLLLRGNFMVMGGLQFITNPVTAAPIYYATYRLGSEVLEWTGFGEPPRTDTATSAAPYQTPRLSAVTPDTRPPVEMHWGHRIGRTINALVIGGVISGTLLGLLLDVSWRLLVRRFGPQHLHVRRQQPPPTVTGPPGNQNA